jgi:hypothetical protein
MTCTAHNADTCKAADQYAKLIPGDSHCSGPETSLVLEFGNRPLPTPTSRGHAMKITVEVSPEDLAVITEQVMKAAGPETMSKIWMAVSEQIVQQMQAQMVSQMPEPFRPFFSLKPDSPAAKSG